MEFRNQAIWHVVSSCEIHIFHGWDDDNFVLDKAVSLSLTMAVDIVVAWMALAWLAKFQKICDNVTGV